MRKRLCGVPFAICTLRHNNITRMAGIDMTDRESGTGRPQHPRASHLFLVRLWEEPSDGTSQVGTIEEEGAYAREGGATDREWKGKVQHVVTGESHTFQDLPSLLDYLRAMMPAPDPGTPGGGSATTE
jgi:hypothetical protein